MHFEAKINDAIVNFIWVLRLILLQQSTERKLGYHFTNCDAWTVQVCSPHFTWFLSGYQLHRYVFEMKQDCCNWFWDEGNANFVTMFTDEQSIRERYYFCFKVIFHVLRERIWKPPRCSVRSALKILPFLSVASAITRSRIGTSKNVI